MDTQGDSFFVDFRRGKDAVAAAVGAQRDLAAYPWPDGAVVKVRMGLHTGEPEVGEDRYVGLGVHKAARIGAAGHGGQVLLSRTTRELVEDDLPTGVTIRDLGERRLKDVDRPERLSQLVIEGLPSQFGPLKTLDVDLRRKRRRMYAVAAIAVLVAAVAIPVFALDQGSSGGANVEPNSVAIIDPRSNRVVGSVTVGVDPAAITVGEGSAWVANTADQTVSRIDARTRRVVRTIPVGEYPGDLAVTPGSVGVALGAVPEVRRVAVERDEAGEALPAAPPRLPGTGGQACGRSAAWLAAGGGALWFACGNDVDTSDASRIDVRAAKATRIEDALVSSSPAAVLFSDIAFGLGSTWITDRGANAVRQIAAQSLENVRNVTVGRGPSAVAVYQGSVWVANHDDDTVTRLIVGELIKPDALATIPVGDGPVDLAAGQDAIWVVNAGDRTISRIDREAGTVVSTIGLENKPVRIAAGEGAVWVTVQEGREG